jgi:hypothetical protein
MNAVGTIIALLVLSNAVSLSLVCALRVRVNAAERRAYLIEMHLT